MMRLRRSDPTADDPAEPPYLPGDPMVPTVADQLLGTPPSTVSDDDLTAALAAPPPTTRALRLTRVLVTALVLVLGFLAGVVAERNLGSGSSQVAGGTGTRGGFDTSSLPSGFPSGMAFPGANGGGTGQTGTGSAAQSGSTPTTGDVTLVDGDVIYLTQSDGTQLRVEIGTDTTIEKTKTTTAHVKDIKEGDTVTVTGTTTDSGLAATSVEVSK